MTEFSKRTIYNSKVAPLVKEIIAVCKSEKIPFFFSAAVEGTETTTTYVSEALTAIPMEMPLANDEILKHINVQNGFDTILPEMMPELEFEVVDEKDDEGCDKLCVEDDDELEETDM